MADPVISVLMPVYNVEKYVAEAIESILQQTFTDFEFLIIDDGSKDGSLAICREYEKKDPRVKVLTQANTGISRALNKLIEVSRGEFLARMDSDDTTAPRRFEIQLQYLREHPEVVVVGSQGVLTDPEGRPVRDLNVPCEHEEIDRRHIQALGTSMLHNAVMIRRGAMLKVGGYRPEYDTAEDLDLWLRLAEVGKLVNQPLDLVSYRRHETSTWFRHRPKQRTALEGCTRDAYRRRGLEWPKDWVHPMDRPQADNYDPTLWGWRALMNGNVGDARHYAWLSLRRGPWSFENWKLLACTIRGY